MTLRFDESLPRLAATLAAQSDAAAFSPIVVLRDASGRLSIVLPAPIGTEQLATMETTLRDALQGYGRPDRIVSDADSPGAQRLLKEAANVPPLTIHGLSIRLLDRRIVGADWLTPPTASTRGIPRVVFASLKGGVGRSTALCVLAAHLSRRGRRVLAIDFDLEAPGIGTMLLRQSELPKFGTLDYLVENGLSGIDDAFMADLSGDSFLGASGARVTVIPAIGQSTIENPGDALSKIARAYLEDVSTEEAPKPLSAQLRDLVDRFEATKAYDVVLVDSRAGLHETTGAAILGLGADVLLFGIDQPQTFLGYRLLMAHLARFPISSENDWRDRLRFVHAKAPDSAAKRLEAEERFMALYEALEPSPQVTAVELLTAEDIEMSWVDSAEDIAEFIKFEVPPILHFFDDARYRDFDPVSDNELLSSPIYSATFQPLLEFADMIVDVELDKP